MADQLFERGLMLWRKDTSEIFVLRGENRRTNYVATVYPDRFQEGDPEDSTQLPPSGLEAPKRGFGRLWRDKPDLSQSLGWAKSPERGFEGAVQEFQQGRMLWAGDDQRLIWVIYENGDTLVVRDRFGP
jgi:hypothetical protein